MPRFGDPSGLVRYEEVYDPTVTKSATVAGTARAINDYVSSGGFDGRGAADGARLRLMKITASIGGSYGGATKTRR